MNKLYSVHDHWTDIDKKNDVDIESIDGVITRIKVNGEDYGGSITWESVYSGSIDPEGEVSPFTAYVSLTMTATDLIKVVYDGVEYVLSKQVFNEKIYYGAEPAILPADIDFTNYPFLIQVSPEIIRVYTETAGLHTVAISVPASGGGSSDFSTANVTIIGNNDAMGFLPPSFPYVADNNTTVTMPAQEENSHTYTVVLYKGSAWGVIRGADIKAMTGGIELSQDEEFLIVTGDGTLTIEPW